MMSGLIFHRDQIFHVIEGCRVSAGPCPSLMNRLISCDGSVRKGPNLQPLRHDSYTASMALVRSAGEEAPLNQVPVHK